MNESSRENRPTVFDTIVFEIENFSKSNRTKSMLYSHIVEMIAISSAEERVQAREYTEAKFSNDLKIRQGNDVDIAMRKLT